MRELVVVGSHGRSGFQAALLGSVSRHVVDQAACPVVVVKGRPRREPRSGREAVRLQGLALRLELGRLRGQVAVAVGDPARGVRPPAKGHVPVADRDIGMVVIGLRELADAVHERRVPRRSSANSNVRSSAPSTSVPSNSRHGAEYLRSIRDAGSTENAASPALERPDARRAGRELVLEFVFRPLSNVIVRPLARAGGVPPSAVVLANASFGLARRARALLARSSSSPRSCSR